MKFIPSEPQKLIFSHLGQHPDAMLNVGMGLGKTGGSLDFINNKLQNGTSRGALVVAPLMVKNLVWPAEVEKYDHTRWMKVADLRTAEGEKAFMRGSANIYLINWDSLPHLAKLVASRKSSTTPYDMVFFDESTKAKSNDSKRVAIYRKFCPRVKRHVSMTGTPIPNNLLDIWGQMLITDGGKRLGPSFEAFKKRFFTPVDWREYKWTPQPDAEQRIYKRIADITLTLKTSDYLDLPDVLLDDVDVDLPAGLMKQYKAFEKEMVLQLRDGTVNALNAAVLVTKLLQFTSGAIYTGEKLDRVQLLVHDHKIQALKKLVKDIGQPVLVMCQFQHEYDRLRKEFPKAEFMWDCKNRAQQVAMEDRWNRGKISQLMANPKSMSHGLNMQYGGCHIIWLSLTYSQEMYNQSIGRLFRRGQTLLVHNHRMMCPGTVDWAVAEALRTKEMNQSALVMALQNLEASRALKGSGGLGLDYSFDDFCVDMSLIEDIM